MSEQPRVVCPHCGKEFEGDLLVSASAPGPRGFKCPHCRLFVPLERSGASAAQAASSRASS